MTDDAEAYAGYSPRDVPVRVSGAVVGLSLLVALLAAIATAIGLLWQGEGKPYLYETLRRQTVEIHGRGLYRYDTLFQGAGNTGTDLTSLLLGIPLLLASLTLYRRESLRGGLLLLGALIYFLYVYASYALNVAYNELFLLYVALFSASLWALLLAFRSIDPQVLGTHCSVHMPRRVPALFLLASGVVTLAIWLIEPVSSLIQHEPPQHLDTYTTLFTNALDMAVIVPAVACAGVLIGQRSPVG